MRALCVLMLGLTACNIWPTSFSKLTEEDAQEDGVVNPAADPCDGAVQEAIVPISFPTYNGNCAFDNDINGKPAIGFWQAYVAQKATVEWPAHTKLCNAKLNSVSSKMLYADALVLLWDQYVLFSSEKLATQSRLENDTGTGLIWNWENMRGSALRLVDEPFCIDAGGSCLMPKAGAYDTANITLNPISLKAILDKQAGKTATDFTLITGGDGADWEPFQDTSLSDCYHRTFDFELTVSYVPSTIQTLPESSETPAPETSLPEGETPAPDAP